MGIPRFYRWLKTRYPLIRIDLSDSEKQLPIFDNFYIDFNALIYQCIREKGCFLKNKVKPLTIEQIHGRVFDYLQELVRKVNPQKLLFIALDGTAPRAKINQSRDRRFKSGVQDIDFFDNLLNELSISGKEIFQANSISPGTEFLYNLCEQLKIKIMRYMQREWKHLNVLYSDSCVPGQGEHKIMQFLRYAKSIQLFNADTTHCLYSPDADVILLALAQNISNICLIKENTNMQPSMSWTAKSANRKAQGPLFEIVIINIVQEYFEQQFKEQVNLFENCTIQAIINDLVLLMAFVGNDFLPLQFCFSLKDNHMDILFDSYKKYLGQRHQCINNEGVINWANIQSLLRIVRAFEANMISDKIKNQRHKQNDQEEMFNENEEYEINNFEVVEDRITKGQQKYYKTRFNIDDNKDPRFTDIIAKYIQGLEFYCQYYYKGLPSWSWFYPYHYTPLLCDVEEYVQHHKINVKFAKSLPYENLFALMFMLPEQNFGLLPKAISDALIDPNCPLRTPHDYFPKKFNLDQYETLKYNKRALIEFLDEDSVRKVYESIPKADFSNQQLQRNSKHKTLLLYSIKEGPGAGKFGGMEIQFDQKFTQAIKQLIRPKYQLQVIPPCTVRFPTLKIFGKYHLNEKHKIVSMNRYQPDNNESKLVFFNNFLGYVISSEVCNQDMRQCIQSQYERAGIYGKCDKYYVVRRARYIRQFNRFNLVPTAKQIIVPDYALFHVPDYQYLRKIQPFEQRSLYEKNQHVVVLSPKYFGYIGTVVDLEDKTVKAHLTEPGIRCQTKIEQLQMNYYTINSILKHLDIREDTLLAILSDVTLLLVMDKKKQFNERLPVALNFGLNFIDMSTVKIVPRFIRYNFMAETNDNSQEIFKKMEISESAVQILRAYVNMFHWLIDQLEEGKVSFKKKEIRARDVFKDEEDINIRAFKEFIKLYEMDITGSFATIYSKTFENLDQFICDPSLPDIITLEYHEIISRRQATLCPPMYKVEPEYHAIGDRVILLRTLETGYVIGIDDDHMIVAVGRKRKQHRVHFLDLYNQKWDTYRCKQQGKCWNMELGYYTPTYWKKVIDL